MEPYSPDCTYPYGPSLLTLHRSHMEPYSADCTYPYGSSLLTLQRTHMEPYSPNCTMPIFYPPSLHRTNILRPQAIMTALTYLTSLILVLLVSIKMSQDHGCQVCRENYGSRCVDSDCDHENGTCKQCPPGYSRDFCNQRLLSHLS